VGMVFTIQVARSLSTLVPGRRGAGAALTRELAPVLTGVVLAGESARHLQQRWDNAGDRAD